jgi:YHS domain-containing protein
LPAAEPTDFEPLVEVMTEPTAQSPTVPDPVCGMTVEAVRHAIQQAYDGVTYYFCSDACQDEFRSDPGRYAVASRKAPIPATVERRP